jgi:hypothetical protein
MAISLHPDVETRRPSCCFPQVLILRGSRIELRSYFCCSGHDEKTLRAFRTYLEKTYKPSLIPIAETLVNRPLTLHLRNAQPILTQIKELNRRFEDINRFVIWVHWHHLYEQTREESSDEACNPSNLEIWDAPPTPRAHKENGGTKRLDQAELYRQLEHIPIEGLKPGDLLALQGNLRKHTLFLSNQELDCQRMIVKELIGMEKEIVTPSEALINTELRDKVACYLSAETLPAELWIPLLQRKSPYMEGQLPTLPDVGGASVDITQAIGQDFFQKLLNAPTTSSFF